MKASDTSASSPPENPATGCRLRPAEEPEEKCRRPEPAGPDDRIALRYTLRGRHDGELAGIPASGQRMSSDGMVFARFQDGGIVERWQVHDDLTLLQQIGGLPAAEAAVLRAEAGRRQSRRVEECPA